MTFTFSRFTFEDQFQKLYEAKDWLKSIGVETEHTRLDDLFRLNKEIVESHKANLIEGLIEKHGNLKLWFALTEASPLTPDWMWPVVIQTIDLATFFLNHT